MRLLLSCGLLWAGLSGVWAAGQGVPMAQTTVVEPPTPLLPTNDRLAAPDVGHADSDEAQAVLKEDGVRRSESRAVAPSGGAAQGGWVSAYEFQDATGAFAAYTYLREGGRQVGAGTRVNGSEVELANGQTVFLSGVSVVRGQVKGADAAAFWKGIEIGLPKVGGRRGLAPLLPTLVPAAGLEAANVHYAVGPVAYKAMGGQLPAEILGWDKSAEVVTASYHGRGTLTLLLYPTPQIAGDRLRAVQQAIDQTGDQAGGSKTFGTVVLRRVGPLVGVTTGAWTQAQAKALLGTLHLNQEISFDQKMPLEFHAEVKKTASLLENIAVFSGVMIVAAILLGLFLGVGRAGIRVMMGKSAASEPEFLTIDLRERADSHFEKIGSRDGTTPPS